MTPTAGLEPNWTAIILVGLLLLACVPLYRSMRKHMRGIEVPTLAEILEDEKARAEADRAPAATVDPAATTGGTAARDARAEPRPASGPRPTDPDAPSAGSSTERVEGSAR